MLTADDNQRLAAACGQLALYCRTHRDRYRSGCPLWHYWDGRRSMAEWIRDGIAEGTFTQNVSATVNAERPPLELRG